MQTTIVTNNYVLKRDDQLKTAALRKRSSTRALSVDGEHYDELAYLLRHNYDGDVLNAQLDGIFRVFEAEIARNGH